MEFCNGFAELHFLFGCYPKPFTAWPRPRWPKHQHPPQRSENHLIASKQPHAPECGDQLQEVAMAERERPMDWEDWKWLHRWPRLTIIEWWLEWLVYWCRGLAIFEVLEFAGRASVLVALIVWISEAGDREKQKHYRAWELINSARGSTGDGGRRDALQDLNEDKVDLSGAPLDKAYLDGVQLQNARLLITGLNQAALNRANLSGAYLGWADLSRAALFAANLSGASLVRANLSGAYLVRANLSGAYLTEANLIKAGLSEADLSGADLSGANLEAANLSGASLERVKFCRTTMPDGTLNNRDCPPEPAPPEPSETPPAPN